MPPGWKGQNLLMGEWVWVTNLPTALWPSTVPGQGMILGNSTTDLLEYLSWHVLPASDRKTDENSLNNKKCVVSPNKASGISGCRVGKFSSSMEVGLSLGFSVIPLVFPSCSQDGCHSSRQHSKI